MRAEQVQAVIKANKGWTEEDVEFLTETDDKSFAKIHANVFPPKADEEKKDEEMTAEEKAAEEAKLLAAKKKALADAKAAEEDEEDEEMKANKFIASAPEGIREVLQQGLKTHAAEKASLVSALKANKRCLFTETQLSSKSLDELRSLATLARVDVDFSAAAGAALKDNAADANAVPAMPKMTW